MIQLVKVAKIKEGDIKHKYVCDGGIIDPPITIIEWQFLANWNATLI